MIYCNCICRIKLVVCFHKNFTCDTLWRNIILFIHTSICINTYSNNSNNNICIHIECINLLCRFLVCRFDISLAYSFLLSLRFMPIDNDRLISMLLYLHHTPCTVWFIVISSWTTSTLSHLISILFTFCCVFFVCYHFYVSIDDLHKVKITSNFNHTHFSTGNYQNKSKIYETIRKTKFKIQLWWKCKQIIASLQSKNTQPHHSDNSNELSPESTISMALVWGKAIQVYGLHASRNSRKRSQTRNKCREQTWNKRATKQTSRKKRKIIGC